MKKHDIDLEWIKEKYLDEKLSTCKIAKLKHVSASVIESRLTRAGIKLRNSSKAASLRRKKSKYPKLNDSNFLRQKYNIEKKSSNEIAKEVGCYGSVVLRALKKHGIKIRDTSQAAKIIQEQRPKLTDPKLKDKSFLYNNYIVDKKCIREIAEKIGTYPNAVSQALKEYDIPIRDLSEARKNASFPDSKYEKLNDKDWLYQKYIIEKLGIRKIAKLVGARICNSVRQALIKFDIPVRNISDGLTCNRRNDGFVFDKEILDGCLLGDGFLRAYNRKSDKSYPYFCKHNIYYDHVSFVAKQIFKYNWRKKIKEYKNTYKYKGEKKHNTVYGLRSYCHKELLSYFREWYPPENDYKKVIPRSVELTPTVLLHWFLDDGCSYKRKRKTRQIIIALCSECFYKENQEFLQEQFIKKFGIKTRLKKIPCKNYDGYRIIINQSYADKFYNVIGPPPVPNLAYKWK